MKAALSFFSACLLLAFALIAMSLPARPTHAQYVPPSPTPPIPDIYPPQVIPDDALVSVLWPRVNLRSAPSVDNSTVITIIKIGEEYPLVGFNADESWAQINVRGTVGWVLSDLVIIVNPNRIEDEQDALNASVYARTQALARQFSNPYLVGVSGNLNLRQSPDSSAQLLTRIPAGSYVTVLARNRYGTWWQVNANGNIGWVSGYYLLFRPDFPIRDIPIR